MSLLTRRIALLAVAIGAVGLVARLLAPGPADVPPPAVVPQAAASAPSPPLPPPPLPSAAVPPSSMPPAVLDARAAVEVIDLASGRALLTQRPEVLDRPGWPASIAKVFTLRAALDAGIVDASTRIACEGRITIDGRTLQCVHPRVGRPLSAVEALSQSCNAFFTVIRVPPAAVSAAWAHVGLRGLPPLLSRPRLAFVGLDGERVAPRRLLRGFARLVEEALGRRSPSDTILVDGLRAAAREGTAAAFAARGVDALAKTGTAPLAGGQSGGIVVAVVPADTPRLAVVALGAGIAGRDAAAIAAAAIALVQARPQGVSSGSPAPDTDPTRLRIGEASGEGYRVREIDLEDYVAGVVAAESGPEAPPAVREALAVAARSYALALRGRHASEGFDLCDLTHCQVYRAPGAADRAAARATEAEVLVHGGRIVPGYHSASCGGFTESPDNVWPGRHEGLAALIARPDPAGSDHGDDWRTDVAAADVLAVLRDLGRRGDEVRGLVVERFTPSGRARVLVADGVTPADVDAEAFRLAVGRRLGWQTLKSSMYVVQRTAHGFRFVGRGKGHGVGLCVAGATRLARAGQRSREIVGAYFPSAQVGPWPGARAASNRRARVVLPALDEAERSQVEDLVQGHVEAVERESRGVLPRGVTVRFHASVESYVRATGQPWWTSGATAGTRIDLLPLDLLRRRGLLDRTLRHEIAHVVTAPALAGTPLWVREGVARLVSGERPAATPAGAQGCPADGEFAAAASAEQLAAIYDRALACVAGEVTRAGGDWRRAAGVRADTRAPGAPRPPRR